jgi:Domain of unknown function (DUF1707)/Cell wall-active antibiotics response 4TMS YvqF
MADNSWMDPQGFNENSRLRASDADRDAAAAVINNALAEGRLTAEEHSDRLDAIYSAKTHAELVPLLDDLPGQRAALAPTMATSGELARSRRGSRIIAIFGGASRKGAWHAEPVINVLAVFGGVELDFRDAILPGKEVILKATAVLGGIEVTVPPEMRVVDNGIAILGGREIAGNADEAASPDAPVLRVEGACVMGGIEVKRKSRKPMKALRRGKGINVSVESDPFPVVRIRSRENDD